MDAAIGELRRQTEQAGLGEPHVLDTRTEWITYFARAGTMRAIVRNNGARSDKQWQGFLAIPLGGDPRLPLEVLEPSMLEEAAALDDNPEISLDDFDAIVRQKVGHQLRSEALAGGFTPFDIDLHPFWKAEVCLVHLPLQRIEFSLTPPLGMFEKLEPRGTRSYGALVGLHDGRTKIIDLPRIKRFADLGMAVGLGMGLLVLVGLALVVIVVVLAVLSS